MPDKKHGILIAIGISLLLGLVISIYTHYSNKSLTSPEMFGLEQEQEVDLVQTESADSNINEIEDVFAKLIESYNNKDIKLLEQVDYRYATHKNTQQGKNYVMAINQCYDFQSLKVWVKDVSVKSINGYFIYSYKKNGENLINYVLTEYTIKSLNGKLIITYLNTVSSDNEEILTYLNN